MSLPLQLPFVIVDVIVIFIVKTIAENQRNGFIPKLSVDHRKAGLLAKRHAQCFEMVCLFFADTCNVDRSVFHASWTNNAPLTMGSKSSVLAQGIIPTLLLSALNACYGFCSSLNESMKINYVIDGTGVSAFKSDFQELKKTLNVLNDFTFPVFQPRYKDPDFQYIELIAIPGAALLQGNAKAADVGNNVAAGTHAIAGEMLIFILLCWLFGIIMWAAVGTILSTFFLASQTWGHDTSRALFHQAKGAIHEHKKGTSLFTAKSLLWDTFI